MIRKTSSLLLAIAACCTASAEYRISATYELPSGGKPFTNIRLDPIDRRIYVAHDSSVEVLDADSGKKIGVVSPTNGAQGIQIVSLVKHGFAANGPDGTASMFDTDGLKVVKVIQAGKNPDAIGYDFLSKRVFVVNAGSGDLTAIDPATGDVLGTVDVKGGKLGTITVDGHGSVLVTDGEKNAIYGVLATSLKLKTTWKTAPGEGPTGGTVDAIHRRAYFACANGLLVVMDSVTGASVASVPVGKNPDGVVFDPGSARIFVANGDGTLTIIHQDNLNNYTPIQTLQTGSSSNKIALDINTGRVFIPSDKGVLVISQ